MDENREELRTFKLEENNYLNKKTDGYYAVEYRRFGNPGNPDYLNTLKNTFNDKEPKELQAAKAEVEGVLCRNVPEVMKQAGLSSCTMVCVPRAKSRDTYSEQQLFFQDAVSQAARSLDKVADGTNAITRTTSTKTTHFRKAVDRVTADGSREPNSGSEPYPGITKDTCKIDEKTVCGKNVLLVDDIYTANVNIDEDCAQAMYDAGAKSVTFFAIACTT